jgi:hypothetical protein
VEEHLSFVIYGRVGPIYLANNDTDTSVSAHRISVLFISVLAILVSVLVSATLDISIGHIGIGYSGYQLPNTWISAKTSPNIG